MLKICLNVNSKVHYIYKLSHSFTVDDTRSKYLTTGSNTTEVSSDASVSCNNYLTCRPLLGH